MDTTPRDRSTKLGQGSIPQLLLAFSAPAVVGMIAQALYNVVDRIFVGQAVGPMGIAGATVAFPFMLILMAFGMLVGFGSAALISIRLGQQRPDDAERVLGHAVMLLALVSMLLTGVGLLLLAPLLTLFGASDQVLPYARDYLRIIVIGSIFQTLGFGLNAIIRGEGNPRIAMYTMLLGAVTNAILDPIFLFGFGWGMRGAAAATIIAQAASAVWVLSYFFRGRSLLALRVKNLRLRWSTSVSIVSVGSPTFATQIASSVLNAILNNQLRLHGGDLAVSVMGIIYAVVLFVVMPIFGINQGAQPIIGYNYGARKYDRVKRTLFIASLSATAITSTGFLVVMLAPGGVIRLFNRGDAALAELGTHAIRVCACTLPIIGFQIVGASYFQAVGKPKHALLLGLSRQVLVLIPAVIVLPYFFGLEGIWLAMPIADVGSSMVTGLWLARELRHLGRRQTEIDGKDRPHTPSLGNPP